MTENLAADVCELTADDLDVVVGACRTVDNNLADSVRAPMGTFFAGPSTPTPFHVTGLTLKP